MIKEYADRIREEIKLIEEHYSNEMLRPVMSREGSQRSNENCKYLRGIIEGLNKALDIYLELVKEDL